MVRWTDRLAMTIAVDLDVKQQNKHAKSPYCKSSTRHEIEVRKYTDPAEVNITLRVDKSICLPKLKSLTVLLYGFSTMNENSLLSLLLLKSCSTYGLSHKL